MSRSGAHEALRDHRFDMLIRPTSDLPRDAATEQPEPPAGPDDELYAIWDDIAEEWIR